MYKLPKLEYPFNAYEPYIDAKTMEIHHDKHHAAYVNNLNLAVEKFPKYSNLEIDELMKKLSKLPAGIKKAVRNHGGGHANHTLFWKILVPAKLSKSRASVIEAIEKKFSSLEKFKEVFSNTALSQFGSGWAWLVVEKNKQLKILSTANQDTPVSKSLTPIMNLDVWEHAYYLKYQNRRAEYIAAWWNLVNWQEVDKRYRKAIV
jgi:Fe-Mn family superoxide dismutase